jgi:hypothetical protein
MDQSKEADGASGAAAAADSKDSKAQASAKPKSTAIWDESDVTAAIVDDDTTDGRLRCEYEIAYKQHVTTGDVYLNMGMKDVGAERSVPSLFDPK